MMGSFEALGDAIMQFEGWKLASRSWRNRNPGNLRRASDTLVGQPVDKDGYRIFDTLDAGWLALKRDIEYKIYNALENNSKHNLNANSTLLDFLNIYAPAGDNNNPTQYTKFVCSWMSAILTPTTSIVITPATTLKEIASM